MKIIDKFKFLLKFSPLNQKTPPLDLFSVVLQATNENEALEIIEKEKLIEATDIKILNEKMLPNTNLSLLEYCVNQQYFTLASKVLKKSDCSSVALDKALHYLFLEKETKPFFDELFSKKRTYQGNIYHVLPVAIIDSPNEAFILNLVNTFNIDLTQKVYMEDDILPILQEREELPRHSLKAVLNTHQFSRERLEKILNCPHPQQIEDFNLIIQNYLIEKEHKHLNETLVEMNSQKNKKQKI